MRIFTLDSGGESAHSPGSSRPWPRNISTIYLTPTSYHWRHRQPAPVPVGRPGNWGRDGRRVAGRVRSQPVGARPGRGPLTAHAGPLTGWLVAGVLVGWWRWGGVRSRAGRWRVSWLAGGGG